MMLSQCLNNVGLHHELDVHKGFIRNAFISNLNHDINSMSCLTLFQLDSLTSLLGEATHTVCVTSDIKEIRHSKSLIWLEEMKDKLMKILKDT